MIRSFLYLILISVFLTPATFGGEAAEIGVGMTLLSFSEDYGYTTDPGGAFLTTIDVQLWPEYLHLIYGVIFESHSIKYQNYVESNYFVQFPIYLKSNISFGNRAVVTPIFGPELGIYPLTKTVENGNEKMSYFNGLKFNRNFFDLGITAGIGLEIPISTGAVFARCSYTLGLTEVKQEVGLNTYTSNHRLTRLIFGYKFVIQ